MSTLMVPVCVLVLLVASASAAASLDDPHQPLSKIAIHKSRILLTASASISASPSLLKSQASENVVVSFSSARPTPDDWIGAFSPANFNSSVCPDAESSPALCTAPIKFQYANFSTGYSTTGNGSLQLRIINQRQDLAFGLFTGGLDKPVLLAVSNSVRFADPKAPLYPRLALGKDSEEIAVTWTSGYSLEEAAPFLAWRTDRTRSYSYAPAHTLTYTKNDLCGPPANSVGWLHPGYVHTSYLEDLWPNTKYYYKLGHRLKEGPIVFSEENYFTSPPSTGQESVQRVIVFGDMGKAERDFSNEFSNYQPGSLNTTDRLLEDLDNYDLVFHIGDLAYSNGYLSQWDQFIEQVGGITKRVPYMLASGNHERDWPLSGSFFNSTDSGGECGVPTQTLFNMPTKNKDHYWYSADYGMFRFCIADSEHDWREGTEQYRFLEECLSTVDREKQPWLIFIAHRVLGYSSGFYYALDGSFAEPFSRESLQGLWQKYKVDIAFYGHIHNYERTCPVFQNVCISDERNHYSGIFNATIHIVAGGGGAHLANFTSLSPTWSLVRDLDFGFTKLTAFNHSSLLFEYKRSNTGEVVDSFTITRHYLDILGCDSLHNCPEVQLV